MASFQRQAVVRTFYDPSSNGLRMETLDMLKISCLPSTRVLCRVRWTTRSQYMKSLRFSSLQTWRSSNAGSRADSEAVTAVKPKSWKPKSVNARLKNFEPLIMEFWRVLKRQSRVRQLGNVSKGNCEKFLDAYGDTVVNDQLGARHQRQVGWHRVLSL